MQNASHKTKQVEPAETLDNPASFAKFIRVSAQCVRNWTKIEGFPLIVSTGRIVRFERAAALEFLNKGGVK
jgi:hypothetical protein